MTAHPAIAAVPKADKPNRTLLQNLLIGNLIAWLDPDADPEVFDPRGDLTGAVVPVIFWRSNFYELDPDDSTTGHDAASCLVTADGGRYKLIFDDLLFQFAVLSATVTGPPDPDAIDEEDRPEYGDAYLVPAGASGAWATHADDVAIFTTRDTWTYIEPRIGRLVYVRDVEGFFHYGDSGAWIAGLGAAAVAAGSIVPSQLKGGGGRVRWIVENQTTNTPPSIVDGISYVVGPSPTGRWVGHAGKIATGEGADEVIYAPSEGWRLYDKSTDGDFVYSGSAWITASGNLTLTVRPYTSSTTWNKPARLAYVEVTVIGGGGGAVGGVSGGASSFGAHASATGGAAGTNIAGGAGGSGSGGDLNLAGGVGGFDSISISGNFIPGGSPGQVYGPFGLGGAGSGSPTGAGGGGGASTKVIQVASLGSTESVTIGAAGGSGGAGFVLVREYTYA